MHLILHQQRAENSDSEICVEEGLVFAVDRRLRDEVRRERRPVGVKLPRRHGEHDHQQSPQSEYPLDPFEFENPDQRSEDQRSENEHQSFVPSCQQMENDADGTELRRAGEEVQEIRGDQRE